jgi:predicted nuclease of predicted toxin-antitoxin system
MTLRFAVDANLPIDLAIWLKEKGWEATHVYSFGAEGTTDEGIWLKAKSAGFTIISKDFDFVRMNRADPTVQVVYYRRGNISKRSLLAHFDAILPQIINALENGESLIEVS